MQTVKNINELEFIPWHKLKNTTILITGATGLIGTEIINSLNYVNYQRNLNLKVLALVRDKERAKQKFSAILNDGMLKLVADKFDAEYINSLFNRISI